MPATVQTQIAVGNAAGHMSKSNKDIIKEFIQATNNRDWDKLDDLVSMDFIRHSSSDSAIIDSRDKLKQFHQRELVTFPDIKETILLLIQEGDYVAARLNFQGTQSGDMGPFPATGKKLNADFNCIFKLTNGKISESWVEYDNLNGLIQLGHYKLPDAE